MAVPWVVSKTPPCFGETLAEADVQGHTSCSHSRTLCQARFSTWSGKSGALPPPTNPNALLHGVWVMEYLYHCGPQSSVCQCLGALTPELKGSWGRTASRRLPKKTPSTGEEGDTSQNVPTKCVAPGKKQGFTPCLTRAES